MLGGLIPCLLTCASGAFAQDPHTPLIGPFFAVTRSGELVARAIAPTPGTYTFEAQTIEFRGRVAHPAPTMAIRATAEATLAEGLSLQWRLAMPDHVPFGVELRVLDESGVPVWIDRTSDLPDPAWAESDGGTSCLGPPQPSRSVGLVVASIDACNAAPGWRAVRAERPEMVLAVDDLAAVAPRDLDAARQHYRELYRDADLTHAFGTAQLFNLPHFDGLAPTPDAIATLRRAYAEIHPLQPNNSPWLTETLAQRRREFALFLVDPAQLLAPNSLESTLHQLAFSSAVFKLVVKSGRWLDSRASDDELRAWRALVDRFADLRVTGLVLVGVDEHNSGFVEHKTWARLGYNLVELVCGPATGRAPISPVEPDPAFLPGTAMRAAVLNVRVYDQSVHATLVDTDSGRRIKLERSSTWLRPR
jgi:hypothetical protein